MIEMFGVTVLRAERVLLWDLHAVVPDGMVTVITGRTGSGKSDTMRLLRRELQPAQGEVFLDRMPLVRWSSAQFGLRCACLPQRSVLHFPFSVRDVVDLGRIPRYQLCTPEVHKRIVEEAMDYFALLPLASHPYASLPAAGQKRVQLARVLAQVLDATGGLPVHWLLDEPTAHLDEEGIASLQRVVAMLLDRRACVLFAIRDPRLAARFAQQLLVIEGGTLVADSAHATPFGVIAPTRAAQFSGQGRA
ncbi:MAG: ATP-binding cassette domain-containing protein [Bryobacterales bacterium]|jgi:iron complex transport system ATP-binding protein|nr:ATP-binding cassette domain-containing protein [Bryobacterales bacterium]